MATRWCGSQQKAVDNAIFVHYMRKLLFALVILAIAGFFAYKYRNRFTEPSYMHQFQVPAEKLYHFEGLEGPADASVIKDPVNTSWRSYNTDNPSAMAILLTDTSSGWLGLAHGLKNIGVPFIITVDINEAVKHHTVMVYPVISGKVLDGDALRKLAAIPRNGGNLIGVNVYGGGLNEVFGFDTLAASNSRNELVVNNSLAAVVGDFSHPAEQTIRLTNPVDFPDEMPSNGYTNARTSLITYKNDGTAFLTYKDYGAGKAFAFGLDLGNYFLRYMNERGFDAYRSYANHYEPGMDVILRILKRIYEYSPTAVTIGTVPDNRALSLVLTHDIDYTKSIINSEAYAKMEQSLGVKATYFIQTKYIRDWNDDIFFTEKTVKHLQRVHDMGMEIASHSVSHSRVFSKLPLGTGKEKYPKYQPFVQERTITYNGSILGELRISKFLLEQTIKGLNIQSFRPGHLQHPFALPQALKASGYAYSSTSTANNVQTHLPFMQMYDRGFGAETNVVEIPITIEDEIGAPMLQRLDSALMVADALSRYGGVMNVLIHTDTLGQKIEFEQKLILALKDKAWIGTVRELGAWWQVRNSVQVNVQQSSDEFVVTITNPSGPSIEGLPIQLPAGWQPAQGTTGITIQGRTAVIAKLDKELTLRFRKSQNQLTTQ